MVGFKHRKLSLLKKQTVWPFIVLQIHAFVVALNYHHEHYGWPSTDSLEGETIWPTIEPRIVPAGELTALLLKVLHIIAWWVGQVNLEEP